MLIRNESTDCMQEAEPPFFAAGRKPFVTPQIKGFSRGAGLILPSANIHAPQVSSSAEAIMHATDRKVYSVRSA